MFISVSLFKFLHFFIFYFCFVGFAVLLLLLLLLILLICLNSVLKVSWSSHTDTSASTMEPDHRHKVWRFNFPAAQTDFSVQGAAAHPTSHRSVCVGFRNSFCWSPQHTDQDPKQGCSVKLCSSSADTCDENFAAVFCFELHWTRHKLIILVPEVGVISGVKVYSIFIVLIHTHTPYSHIYSSYIFICIVLVYL